MRKLFTTASLFISFFCKAQTFSYSGPVIGIPDYGPAIDVPITVSGLPFLINSSFGISATCMDIIHTWDSDLEVSLVSPAGTSVILFTGLGYDGDNFSTTCLSENGGNGYIVNAIAPFNGNYIPFNSINAFNNGQNPNGIWTLHIQDTYAFADSGWVNAFDITFSLNPPSDPPPPPKLCTFCTCPGGSPTCDLLPDMTSSWMSIQSSWFEVPGSINFDNATPNIGWGPLEIHGIDSCYCDSILVSCQINICPNGFPPKQLLRQVVYQRQNNNDTLTQFERNAGYMSFHMGHGHVHVDHWADFTVRTATTNPDATTWPIIGTGTKQSFCLVNLGDCDGNFGYCVDTAGNFLHKADIPNSDFGFVTGCGLEQGIYVGNLDIYVAGLNDPVYLPGVCNGNQYYIVSITDPEDNMLETDETNNWVAVPITLTQQMQPPSAVFNTVQPNGSTINCTAANLTNATSYTWYFGDGNSATNVNPVAHVYTQSGTFNVILVVNSPCGTFSDTTTVTSTITGLEYANQNISISVYPNPAKEKTKVSFFLSQDEVADLKIFDASGRNITLINTKLPAGKQEIFFDVNELALSKGNYFIQLVAGKQIEKIKLVVE